MLAQQTIKVIESSKKFYFICACLLLKHFVFVENYLVYEFSSKFLSSSLQLLTFSSTKKSYLFPVKKEQ